MNEVVWCFTYIKEMTLRENYKEVYKLWRERNPVARINLDAKALLNQKNYILKAQRLTTVEIDEIRENIRLQTGEATEDYTNEVNSDRTDANGIEYQKRETKKMKTLTVVKDRLINIQAPKVSSRQLRIN